MKYKTIDLCAGIGGIRRGFEMTGQCKNVLSAEVDEQAARTYEHLYGENPRNNLMDKAFRELVKETQYDILLAGFPCQAFSSAGLKKGFKDREKGNIFFGIAEIIRLTRPKAIFLENVQNLLVHDNHRTIEKIIYILDELKYKIIGVDFDDKHKPIYSRASFIRNTKDFGLPQNRPRAYIMAFNREMYGAMVDQIPHDLPLKSDRNIFENVNEILEKNVSAHYYMSSQYLDTLEKHKERQHKKGNGFGYCVVNDSSREHQIANTIMATGGSGKERNLVYQPKEEFFGLKIQGKASPLNKKGIRVMTPTEWGRLQGFIGYAFVDKNGIDHFSFPEGMAEGQKYKQFGNSVSIPVIECMASFMINILNELDCKKNDNKCESSSS